MVDVKFERKFRNVITLATLREHEQRALKGLALLKRGNRLSITPVGAQHWKLILDISHGERSCACESSFDIRRERVCNQSHCVFVCAHRRSQIDDALEIRIVLYILNHRLSRQRRLPMASVKKTSTKKKTRRGKKRRVARRTARKVRRKGRRAGRRTKRAGRRIGRKVRRKARSKR
jgi:hypothetical protein